MTPPIPFPFTLLTEPAVAAVEAGVSCDFTYCYGGDWVQGKIDNYGMEFDGTDEYITTPSVSDIEFGNDSTFTVAFWVKSAQGSFQGFIGKRVFNAGNYGWTIGRDFGLLGNNNKVYVTVSNGAGQYGYIFSDAVMDAEWHHIAFTRDGATPGNTILYIDGVAQADTTMAGGSGTSAQQSQLADGGQPLYVGRYWHTTQGTGYNLNGTIDDIGIWDVVLPASTIQSLYNSGTGRRVDTVAPPANDGDYVSGYLGNYALSFDSSDSPANHIDINNYSDIHTSPSGSISMWIKPNLSPSFPTLVAAGDNAVSNTFFEYYIDTPSGKVNLVVRNAGTNHTRILNDTAITQDAWNHVVLTSDGTTGKIYLNGVDNTIPRPGFSNNGGYFSDLTGLDNLTLGIMEYNGGTLFGPFSGSMDEVAFWNVELDSGAVSDLYNSGAGAIASSVSSSNLALYYNFEGGPGTSALVDRSNNNHTGSLTNMDAGGITTLKMYYDFEIGDSNPVSGNFPTSTTVYDIVTSSYHGGTAHTGTMTNMAVADFGAWDLGHNGKYSLNFSGTANVGDSVEVANNSSINFTGDMSVATWVYSSNQSFLQGFVSKAQSSGFSHDGWVLGRDSSGGTLGAANKFAWSLRNESIDTIKTVFSNATGPNGDWTHLVGTYRNGTLLLFVNGVQQTDTDTISSIGSTTTAMRLGQWWNQSDAFPLVGNLDEVSVWNGSLDDTSITELYNGTSATDVTPSASYSGATVASLRAYYSMECNGPGSPTLLDLSTSGLNGVLTKMATGSCGAG